MAAIAGAVAAVAAMIFMVVRRMLRAGEEEEAVRGRPQR